MSLYSWMATWFLHLPILSIGPSLNSGELSYFTHNNINQNDDVSYLWHVLVCYYKRVLGPLPPTTTHTHTNSQPLSGGGVIVAGISQM